MPPEFQSFVVFAEMRTGSNFLEANLNQLEGVACHGEAFNPHFLGYPENETILLN
jgi:LPS sulfotransferase NodH